jgi:serine/threonine protein kinase
MAVTDNTFIQTLNPSFALKRLHSIDKVDFDSEVEMHKVFSGKRQHPHLVKLLATYEYKGRFYLLFPYAKANLRSYWEETPVPIFSAITVEWFLRQCKGIASAVLRIHGYQSTQDSLDALAKIQETQAESRTTSSEVGDRIYGRHGDIKPENILWSDEENMDDDPRFSEQGILLIADFGLMKYHKTLTEFHAPERVAGSATYEPPEVAGLTSRAKISRAYDIWSLGCVYLEFITWLVCGWKELDRFRKACDMIDNDGAFFTVLDDGLSGSSRQVIVKESVQEWIQDLHRKPRCSEFIHDVLNLISNYMLVVDPGERIHSGPLNNELSTMGRKGLENQNYLAKPSLSRALDGRERSTPSLKEGSPLPQRPSVAKNPSVSTHARSRNPPGTDSQSLFEPALPISEFIQDQGVDMWTRGSVQRIFTI